jgi:hypothetical protein
MLSAQPATRTRSLGTPGAERKQQMAERRTGEDRRATARGGRRQMDVIKYLTDNDSGHPLSTDQLARAIGVSTTTIRADIKYKALRAFKAGGREGTRKEWRVLFTEAKRYLQQMGVIPKPMPAPPAQRPRARAN